MVGAVDRHPDVVEQGAPRRRRPRRRGRASRGRRPSRARPRPSTSRRSRRSAMLSTIWTWTQEWSDMPSRSEVTWAMCHQARTCASALTPSSSASSLRLPRVGARTGADAIASAGVRPSSPGPLGGAPQAAPLRSLPGRARSRRESGRRGPPEAAVFPPAGRTTFACAMPRRSRSCPFAPTPDLTTRSARCPGCLEDQIRQLQPALLEADRAPARSASRGRPRRTARRPPPAPRLTTHRDPAALAL